MKTIQKKIIHISASDGYILRCRVWEPSSSSKGDILYIHGIQSHSGWYEESSQRLAEAGYRVIFPDRRGSGLNAGQTGDLPNWKMLFSDIQSVLTFFGSPIHVNVLAISWGGKVGAMIAYKHYPWLRKLILITPGIVPKVEFTPSEKMLIARNFLLGSGLMQFPIPIPGPEYFTHDPQFQDYILSDSLTLHSCTARFFIQTMFLDAQLKKSSHFCHVPTFLLLAQDDNIIDNKKVTAYFSKHFTHPSNMIKEYRDCAHTLEFDQKDFSFVDDIVRFLE